MYEQTLGGTSFSGFAAGVVNAEVDGDILAISPVPLLGTVDNLEFFQNGGPGYLSGSISASNGDVNVSTEFGDKTVDIEGSPFTYHSSVYVDDNVYAAWANDETTASVYLDNPYSADDTPSTYFVSSNAVSPPGLSADILDLCTSCSFAEWGWWGTKIDGEYGSVDPTSLKASVHLGTWVAGDIVEDFGNLTSALGSTGLAHYSGYAVGTVVNSPRSGHAAICRRRQASI